MIQTTPPSPSDYYLPDEDLTDHQPRRSRSHGGVSRKTNGDPTAPLAPAPSAQLAASAQAGKARRTLSLGPSLSMGGKSRANAGHSTLATSMTTANGAATPSNAGGAHGLLSSKTASSTHDTVVHPAPTTPLVSPGSAFEAGYVGKIGQRLRDLVNRTFPSAPEAGLVWKGRAAPSAAVATELAELVKGYAVSSR